MEEKQIQSVEKEIIESYKFAISRCNYTVWERRVIYNILRAEDIQDTIKKKITNSKENKITKEIATLFGDLKITMYMKDITDTPSEYAYIKNALKKLIDRKFTYENAQGDFYAVPFLMKTQIIKNTKLEILIDKNIYEMLLDLTKGYRRFNLGIIMALKSIYAMRFYELFCYQNKNENGGEFNYKISDLRQYFMLENKYSTNNRFIEKVIAPAKKELDRVANYSFEYQPMKSKGSRAFDYIHFTIKHIPENEKNVCDELKINREKNALAKSVNINRGLIEMLKEEFLFSENEIYSNKTTFYLAQEIYKQNFGGNWLEELGDYMGLMKRRGTTKGIENINGYIVGGIQRDLNIKNKERREALLEYHKNNG